MIENLSLSRFLHIADKVDAFVKIPDEHKILQAPFHDAVAGKTQDEMFRNRYGHTTGSQGVYLDDIDGSDEQWGVKKGGLCEPDAIPIVKEELGANCNKQAKLQCVDRHHRATELTLVSQFAGG